MAKHDKGYMWTLNGRRFYIRSPKIEDIDIDTGATVLSRICRFGGHTKVFYSVAQHLILVSNYIWNNTSNKDLALHGLFHDYMENNFGDLIKPIKHDKLIEAVYCPLEEKAMKVVAKKIGFTYNKKTKQQIKNWERPIELAEIRDLMNIPKEDRDSLDFTVCEDVPNLLQIAMPAERAKIAFMKTYQKLLSR